MDSEVLTYSTGTSFVTDLTTDARSFVAGRGDGLLHVFVPHATAGIAIMELHAGSESDLAAATQRLLPREDIYSHRHGSRGHGGDHVLPAFVAPSMSLPVVAGQIMLGIWQSIALIDPNVDNPQRTVRLSFLAES